MQGTSVTLQAENVHYSSVLVFPARKRNTANNCLMMASTLSLGLHISADPHR